MRRVVVTGATSMIGCALIRECINAEIEVLAIVRTHSPHMDRLPKSDLVKVIECDLENLDSIMEISEPYDVFYHMAWKHTLKAERDNPLLQETNIKYTLDAVNMAKKLGCIKFIGAGSQAEYGKVDTVITPDTLASPLTSYGMAKYSAGIMSRKLCEQYGITHIWARIFSVYGYYDREETMISYAMNRFLKGKAVNFSSATQMWDYLHEDDVGRIFYLIGELVKENRIYCIASGKSKPLKEFILELRDLCNPEAKCIFSGKINERSRIGLQADIESLVQDIGYRPQISFKEGIEDIVQRQKNQNII